MASTQKPSELFSNLYKVPELKKRFLFTIMALVVYRIGFQIPVPFIDSVRFAKAFEEQIKDSWADGLLGIYNTLSAGSIMAFTIFALGIMPYISSEIIFQLLTKVIPQFEELQKEGESGRRKLKQYSRFATLGICILQSMFVVTLLTSDAALAESISVESSLVFAVSTVLTLTAGTFFLMFLGDKITERGLGNGVSLIIQAGILASVPQTIIKMSQQIFSPSTTPQVAVEYVTALVLLIVMFVAITYGIVQITLGRREIPIQHQKHTRGVGAVARRQSIPLKVDQAGVIPIIFASALLVFPALAFDQLGKAISADGALGFLHILSMDIASAYNGFGWLYEISYVALIFFFTYFWTQLTFSPPELAKNMREWGAYIPGVRPGADTVAYLTTVLKRMTLAGAAFLSLVAIIPSLFPHMATLIFGDSQALTENRLFFRIIGGTGLLIVVSVALDLVQKIEAELLTKSYDGGIPGAGGTHPGGRRVRR